MPKSHGPTQAVRHLLTATPNLTATEIHQRLQLDPQSVRNALHGLVRTGEAQKYGTRPHRYYLSDRTRTNRSIVTKAAKEFLTASPGLTMPELVERVSTVTGEKTEVVRSTVKNLVHQTKEVYTVGKRRHLRYYLWNSTGDQTKAIATETSDRSIQPSENIENMPIVTVDPSLDPVFERKKASLLAILEQGRNGLTVDRVAIALGFPQVQAASRRREACGKCAWGKAFDTFMSAMEDQGLICCQKTYPLVITSKWHVYLKGTEPPLSMVPSQSQPKPSKPVPERKVTDRVRRRSSKITFPTTPKQREAWAAIVEFFDSDRPAITTVDLDYELEHFNKDLLAQLCASLENLGVLTSHSIGARTAYRRRVQTPEEFKIDAVVIAYPGLPSEEIGRVESIKPHPTRVGELMPIVRWASGGASAVSADTAFVIPQKFQQMTWQMVSQEVSA